MKIVFLVGEFPPAMSGIGDYSALLVSELAALGCTITVVTTRMPSADLQGMCQGINVRRVLSTWGPMELSTILQAIDESGPGTILHIQYGGFRNRRRPMINVLPFLLKVLRPKCTVVVTLHEFRSQRLRWRLSVLPMVYGADGTICVESLDRDCLSLWTHFAQPNITWIPIAPNVLPIAITADKRDLWRRQLGIADGTAVVAFFGGADRQKGFLDLIRAITILRNRSVAVKLLAIGPYEPWNAANTSYEREVRKCLEEGEKSGWALTIGKSSPEIVSRYLHTADLAAFPYVRGARPNRGSLLAALAHGLPVVTTDGIDTPASFAEQFKVALVPPNDVDRLARRLEEIITSGGIREHMKQMTLKASNSFSWHSIADRTTRFYRLLQRNAATSRS